MSTGPNIDSAATIDHEAALAMIRDIESVLIEGDTNETAILPVQKFRDATKKAVETPPQ